MPLHNRQLIAIGAMLFAAGMVIRALENVVDQQQELLRIVATDNMKLRFYIHQAEVDLYSPQEDKENE